MQTYFIFMTCDGESDHESHRDPVMMISLAAEPKDLQVIAIMGLGLILSDREGDHISLFPDPKKTRELKDKILDILEEYEQYSSDSVFDVPKELDVDVDLKV